MTEFDGGQPGGWVAPTPAAPVPVAGATPPPPPPGYATSGWAPVAPQYPAGYSGQPAAFSAQNTGWTPPPKPGLIPLRPLTLGDILRAVFGVMRRSPLPTFGTALLLNLVVALVSVGAIGTIYYTVIARANSTTGADQRAIEAGGVAEGIVAFLLLAALSVMSSAIIQGLVSLEVSRASVGERMRIRGLWRRLRGRLGALVGFIVLVGVTAIVATAIAFGILVGIGAATTVAAGSGGSGSSAVGTVLAGTGTVLLLSALLGLAGLVLVAWLGTKLMFVPALIVLERRSVRDAIARSWRLLRGRFWRTFGIWLLVYAMYYVGAQIVSTPVTLIGGIIAGLSGANSTADSGDPSSSITSIVIIYGVALGVGLLVGAIGTVMVSSASSLLFLDARMRSEGLDLELMRYVEAKAAGRSAPDPYLVADGST